ncbi:MAG TPA: hypothetical protein VGE30_00635 [Candidatus Saccharimonadales bacterium]
MLYKQLQRITELDKQIQDMHLRLAEYYRERAALTGNQPVEEVLNTTVTTTNPEDMHGHLVTAWEKFGLKVPTYKTLAKRLTAAANIIDSLMHENHQLAGNMTILAVPPQAQLDELMAAKNLPHDYAYTEEFARHVPKRKTSWTIVIVTAANFALAIDSLSDSLGEAEFTYKQFDCRGLGVREAIAADILGLEIATNNNWTLLLKDAADSAHIPCVTKQGTQLIFDIDDARCLLGNNYLQPAIAIA